MSLTVRRLSAAALIVTGLGIGVLPAVAAAEESTDDTSTVPAESSLVTDPVITIANSSERTCPGATDWAAMKSFLTDLNYNIDGYNFTSLNPVTGAGHIIFTGKVSRLPEGCSIPVGIATYQSPAHDPIESVIAQQVEYDYEVVSATHPSFTLEVDTPDCYGQIDAFVGPNIPSFATGDRYGDRKFGVNDGFGTGWANFGTHACNTTTTTTTTLVTTTTAATTTLATTTTMQIPTTTTIPGTTTTAPSVTTSPTTAAPPTVAAVVVTPAPGGVASEELPRTGSTPVPGLLVGFGMLIGGGVLLGTTKRTTVES